MRLMSRAILATALALAVMGQQCPDDRIAALSPILANPFMFTDPNNNDAYSLGISMFFQGQQQRAQSPTNTPIVSRNIVNSIKDALRGSSTPPSMIKQQQLEPPPPTIIASCQPEPSEGNLYIMGTASCEGEGALICSRSKPQYARIPAFSSTESIFLPCNAQLSASCSEDAITLASYAAGTLATIQFDCGDETGLPGLAFQSDSEGTYFTISHNCACPGANASTCASSYPTPGPDYISEANDVLGYAFDYQYFVSLGLTLMIWVYEEYSSFMHRKGRFSWILGFFIIPSDFINDRDAQFLLAPLISMITTSLVGVLLQGGGLSSMLLGELIQIATIVAAYYPLFISNWTTNRQFGCVIGILSGSALLVVQAIAFGLAVRGDMIIGFSFFPSVLLLLVVIFYYCRRLYRIMTHRLCPHSQIDRLNRTSYVQLLFWQIDSTEREKRFERLRVRKTHLSPRVATLSLLIPSVLVTFSFLWVYFWKFFDEFMIQLLSGGRCCRGEPCNANPAVSSQYV